MQRSRVLSPRLKASPVPCLLHHLLAFFLLERIERFPFRSPSLPLGGLREVILDWQDKGKSETIRQDLLRNQVNHEQPNKQGSKIEWNQKRLDQT